MIRFARGGTELSFFANPETTKPKPMKTINPSAQRMSIFIKVIMPLINVNPKANLPIRMIITEPAIANIVLLIASPITMPERLIGVAKNLFNTNVCRKLRKTKAVPKTPDARSENPN